MELKVSKEITCKWQNQRSEKNEYVSRALFLKVQAAGINFDFINNPVNGKLLLSEKKFLCDMAM